MVQVKYRWLILLLLSVLLLTGCSSKLTLYTVTSYENGSYKVINGDTLYTYDDSGLNQPVKIVNIPKACKPIDEYSPVYTLVHKELSQYIGTMQDAAGYYNKLLNEGFQQTTLTYSSSTLDAKLINEVGDEIRIIYLGNDLVRILYRNISNSNIFPPYINEER